MTANAKPVPPSFAECAHFIGAAWEDRALTEWLKAHRFGKREKMDAVDGEPRAAYARNEKLGVIVELEDDQVVGFSLELLAPAPAPALPDGVAFGATRAAVAKAWGAPAETSKRHDTFKRPYGEKKKPLRVTCTFIRDALEEVQVEWWSRMVERASRESGRIEDTIQAPASPREVPPLPAKFKRNLPDVTSMMALFGMKPGDPAVAKLVKALGLEMQGDAKDGILTGPDVQLGINGGKITSAAIFGSWGGGLENGLQNGTATRADVRAWLGKPTDAAEGLDFFKKDGFRRSITYIDGVVLCWSVERE